MDFFEYRANKVPKKTIYRDSKMKVWNKPEKTDDSIEVKEVDASDSMIMRVIKAFKGE